MAFEKQIRKHLRIPWYPIWEFFLTYSNKTETFPSNLDIQNDFSIMESLLID